MAVAAVSTGVITRPSITAQSWQLRFTCRCTVTKPAFSKSEGVSRLLSSLALW